MQGTKLNYIFSLWNYSNDYITIELKHIEIWYNLRFFF